MARLLFLLAAALSAVSAAPLAETLAARQDPATVNFAPYKEVGCRMSQNPHDNPPPNDYNATTGHCITPPYTFTSYVEAANDLALGPCALSLFPEPNCEGQGVAATLTSYYNCVPSAPTSQSFQLFCGP